MPSSAQLKLASYLAWYWLGMVSLISVNLELDKPVQMKVLDFLIGEV